MNKLNKCVFILCIAAFGSACKSGGGASANADSLSSQSQGQEKWRSGTNRSSSYRSSHRSRYNNRRVAPAPKNTPRPRPAPEPVATPQPAPTPVVVRPEPRPAPTPIAQAPTPPPSPTPQPEPTPEPVVAPTVIGNAKLTWTVPTKRENGDSLSASELSRYEVYYTSESGKEDTIPVDNASQTSLTVDNLEGGTYHFAMVAVDQDGIISELSNSVPKTIK